jgi:hypothetical protein
MALHRRSRLRLLGPKAVMTPMKRYQIAASGAQRVVPGVVADAADLLDRSGRGGPAESIFDEYGNLEAFKGAPLVQPIWRSC